MRPCRFFRFMTRFNRKVLALREKGLTPKEIADALGCDVKKIYPIRHDTIFPALHAGQSRKVRCKHCGVLLTTALNLCSDCLDDQNAFIKRVVAKL